MSHWTARDAGWAIVEALEPFVDLVEVRSNRAWDNPALTRELLDGMRADGWQDGWPYCMALQEFAVKRAYRQLGASQDVIDLIAAKFTPHVLTTWRNLGRFATSKDPQRGALGFMRKGLTDSGHAVAVLLRGQRNVITIEGNTTDAMGGSAELQRNGDGIYSKGRRLRFDRTPTGLHFVGFANPLGSDEIEQLALDVVA